MDYCDGVESFINYALSNPIISIKAALNVCVRGVKIKIFSIRCYNDASFTKKDSRKNTCVGLHMENHMFLSRP